MSFTVGILHCCNMAVHNAANENSVELSWLLQGILDAVTGDEPSVTVEYSREYELGLVAVTCSPTYLLDNHPLEVDSAHPQPLDGDEVMKAFENLAEAAQRHEDEETARRGHGLVGFLAGLTGGPPNPPKSWTAGYARYYRAGYMAALAFLEDDF